MILLGLLLLIIVILRDWLGLFMNKDIRNEDYWLEYYGDQEFDFGYEEACDDIAIEIGEECFVTNTYSLEEYLKHLKWLNSGKPLELI